MLRFIINPIAVRPCGGPIDPHTVEHCHLLKVREGKVGERKEAWGGGREARCAESCIKDDKDEQGSRSGEEDCQVRASKKVQTLPLTYFFFCPPPCQQLPLVVQCSHGTPHPEKQTAPTSVFFNTHISPSIHASIFVD